MRLESVDRAADAYQRPLTEQQIQSMATRLLGEVDVVAAVELGDGTYNTTYRVELERGPACILRVAPEPARQFRSERGFMRSEHAAAPYFAPIATLLPRTLGVDFTHQVIGRDYMFQSFLPGVPAREGLRQYPREAWRPFFRRLGEISKRIHAVRGERFGPVGRPGHPTWSEAVSAMLRDIIADLDDAGLAADDAREVLAIALRGKDILDEVRDPRLLHGDLWTINVMLAEHAPEPTVTGVFDCDRVIWGDPESDWAIYRATRTTGVGSAAERETFWDGYGPLDPSPHARWRRSLYEARNIAGLRLERSRLGLDISTSYDELRAALDRLG
ncbi:aminoglycoside phosphotransferase family protein [Actinospica sp.]|jgi:aminoglycoside phosphotransferase (APT) family kinase protein|uniref:phosphotransferase family protein n=1 Tax=Actinospica sp. TaxID=1872142 RepID=UPI002CE48C04|nr:aminoglycoside phosphotransferase family protein [Actinospica sp.]HWG22552.1 aminoglycoside phosphotransferase family protein [Actinospica sp.]